MARDRRGSCNGPVVVAAVATVAMLTGCGSSSDGDADPSTGEVRPSATASSVGTDDVAATSDPYCVAITAVVDLPVATVRADRGAYVAAVGAVAAVGPPAHRPAWDAVVAFVDDDSSDRLNDAADGLDGIGGEVQARCGIDLVLVDWDLLRDRRAAVTHAGPGS